MYSAAEEGLLLHCTCVSPVQTDSGHHGNGDKWKGRKFAGHSRGHLFIATTTCAAYKGEATMRLMISCLGPGDYTTQNKTVFFNLENYQNILKNGKAPRFL